MCLEHHFRATTPFKSRPPKESGNLTATPRSHYSQSQGSASHRAYSCRNTGTRKDTQQESQQGHQHCCIHIFPFQATHCNGNLTRSVIIPLWLGLLRVQRVIEPTPPATVRLEYTCRKVVKGHQHCCIHIFLIWNTSGGREQNLDLFMVRVMVLTAIKSTVPGKLGLENVFPVCHFMALTLLPSQISNLGHSWRLAAQQYLIRVRWGFRQPQSLQFLGYCYWKRHANRITAGHLHG